MTHCIPQLIFSFCRRQPLRADFSGRQLSSDAHPLPLRAFDQWPRLTRDLAQRLSDPREEDACGIRAPAPTRYEIVAGYEDVNDADRCAMTPPSRFSPTNPWDKPWAPSPP